MTQAEKIGDRVRRLREKRKLTQVELATRASLSEAAISRIERGERQPSLATAWRLSRSLRVSLNTLVRGVEMEP